MDDPRSFVARRLSRTQLLVADGSVAAVYTAVLALFVVYGNAGAHLPLWVRLVVVAGIGLPGAVRRVWPVPVFCVVFAATAIAVFAGVVREPFAAAAFALYLVARTQPSHRLPGIAIGVVGVSPLLVEAVVGSPGWWQSDFDVLLAGGALMACAWTIGRAVRERRAHAARTTFELSGRAVAEERLRIARELHDIVAHSMGVIAVKAGVARHLLREEAAVTGPVAEARDALRVIENTSKTSLDEMRRMLGILRSDVEPAEVGPAPGLDGLPALAEQAAVVGVAVELETRGVGRLPESVQLSVYRIVQEALTNVAKHAAPAPCRVTVTGTGREVRIEVVDEGDGAGRTGAGGHGLIGMRERVALYGGEFDAGRRPGGGFRVAARLPFVPERGTGRESW
ncbi:sensor histidine kinase [Amycolatopsis magusensis]|uniref:sensor histidine kinase n=1 Tax=Amycolatopsis magusensis TaxID=882444 RepID=UPI0024A890B5|nr:sensor histidine kinase [Amycolatopsis magusensis]MDI5981071.1 sensor histidine kinase [Amycolatopsis magusensis]